jgi:hypothetical protein
MRNPNKMKDYLMLWKDNIGKKAFNKKTFKIEGIKQYAFMSDDTNSIHF